MAFTDSHAHLNSPEFKEDWKNIVTKAKNSNVSFIINAAGDLVDAEWGITQAEQEPIVYTTVGVHPEWLSGQAPSADQLINNLRRLISTSSKVVAIGEIGLDYTLDPNQAPKQAQIELLQPQLQLAFDCNLPVVLHIRDQKDSHQCFDDLVNMLSQFTTSGVNLTPSSAQRPASTSESAGRIGGLFHCWTGTPEQAQRALNLGFYISFSGIVTYKSAGHIVQAAAMVPDDRLLIETDSPFLIPEPARSKEHPSTNEPKYVILTAEKLAAIRNTTIDHIANITTANAQQLFKLPGQL